MNAASGSTGGDGYGNGGSGVERQCWIADRQEATAVAMGAAAWSGGVAAGERQRHVINLLSCVARSR
jgi:hypothetical protein